MDAAPAEERLQWVDVVAHDIQANVRGWVTIPACASGRRRGEAQSTAEILDDIRRSAPQVGVLLEHAGHHAFAWSKDRVGAPADVPLTTGERRPRPLEAQEWSDIHDAFVSTAKQALQRGMRVGVVLDDDTLWHAHLSPRLHPGVTQDDRQARVLRLVRALLKVSPDVVVAACVDDLCPDGMDPLAGQRWVQALVSVGVHKLLLSTGSAAMPLLAERALRVTTGMSQQHHALLAPVVRAAKLVDAEVWAAGPFADTASMTVPSPLAGVVRWTRERQP